jgi:hypothetical protein
MLVAGDTVTRVMVVPSDRLTTMLLLVLVTPPLLLLLRVVPLLLEAAAVELLGWLPASSSKKEPPVGSRSKVHSFGLLVVSPRPDRPIWQPL